MIAVARHQEGICLNPLEYMCNKKGKVKTFKNKTEAKAYLKKKGAKDVDCFMYVKVEPGLMVTDVTRSS